MLTDFLCVSVSLLGKSCNYILSKPFGTFGYRYRKKMLCTWVISSETARDISINFDTFNVLMFDSRDHTCRNQSVKIFAFKNGEWDKKPLNGNGYCGTGRKEPISVRAQWLFVVLRSDWNWWQFRGFNASYRITGRKGKFILGLFPAIYRT